ncbi:hypothetical protein F4818DRAFT_430697 [Hypoxylon cercidicola]|nr:hypothetical protein F4818DRAFT_430697 [Hypoxylon cercidicola]
MGKPDYTRVGSRTMIQAGRPGKRGATVFITIDHRLLRLSYHFSVNLRWGISVWERFEWRRAPRGNMAHEMFQHAKGSKLVRLGRKGPGEEQGGKRAARHVGGTSDGKEVVAVLATEQRVVPALGGKPFRFEICGSGKTGELGHHFAYVALMTALQIWYIEIQCLTDLSYRI